MNAFGNDLMLACLAAHGSPAHAEFLGTKAAPVGTQDKNLRTQISIYEVRAHFVPTGTSLNRWAKDRGVNPRQVQAAIRGDRKGPKARKLLADVMNSVRGGA